MTETETAIRPIRDMTEQLGLEWAEPTTTPLDDTQEAQQAIFVFSDAVVPRPHLIAENDSLVALTPSQQQIGAERFEALLDRRAIASGLTPHAHPTSVTVSIENLPAPIPAIEAAARQRRERAEQVCNSIHAMMPHPTLRRDAVQVVLEYAREVASVSRQSPVLHWEHVGGQPSPIRHPPIDAAVTARCIMEEIGVFSRTKEDRIAGLVDQYARAFAAGKLNELLQHHYICTCDPFSEADDGQQPVIAEDRIEAAIRQLQ